VSKEKQRQNNSDKTKMTPEKTLVVKEKLREIAEILYQDTSLQELKTFETIELTVRKQQRREVLDWYHLMENLHKVGGSIRRLKRVENYLWHGLV
jgi:hypothetical protein